MLLMNTTAKLQKDKDLFRLKEHYKAELWDLHIDNYDAVRDLLVAAINETIKLGERYEHL
jgi:hypothetical protein